MKDNINPQIEKLFNANSVKSENDIGLLNNSIGTIMINRVSAGVTNDFVKNKIILDESFPRLQKIWKR